MHGLIQVMRGLESRFLQSQNVNTVHHVAMKNSTRRQLVAASSPIEQRHLKALQGANASRWLSQPPTAPSHTLRDVEFNAAVKYRLYCKLASRMPSRCGCGADLSGDFFGHAVGCSSFKGHFVTGRHDDVKNDIVRWNRRAGNPAETEPRKFGQNWSKAIRPDVLLSTGNSTIAGDVQLNSPTAPSNMNIEEPMERSARAKIAKYSEAVRLGPFPADRFVPIIFETTGGFFHTSAQLVRDVANASRSLPSWDIEQGLINDISFSIQRGNARTLLAALDAGVFVDSADPADGEQSD